jgi:hypothetical protein
VTYFKELREAILLFLTPDVPDGQVVRQLDNTSTMTFTLWKINGEDMIPVFTSPARVEESLQAVGKWNEKNGV